MSPSRRRSAPDEPEDAPRLFDPGPRAGSKRRPGRVEKSLDRAFQDAPAIGPAARAVLRAAAHLVDEAERSGDVDAGAKMVRAYVDTLQTCGLVGTAGDDMDPFAAFVAGLSAPTLRNSPDN